MSKININFQVPFAVESEPVINPKNGYKYTKRITQEFRNLQEFAKNAGIVFVQKDVSGEPLNKNIYISCNVEYFSDFNTLFNLANLCSRQKTPTKHQFE